MSVFICIYKLVGRVLVGVLVRLLRTYSCMSQENDFMHVYY